MPVRLACAFAVLGLGCTVGCEQLRHDPLGPNECGSVVDAMGQRRFRCTRSYISTDTEDTSNACSAVLEGIDGTPDRLLGSRTRRLVLGGDCKAITISPEGENIVLAIETNTNEGHRIVVVESKRPTVADQRGGMEDSFRVVREIAMPRSGFLAGQFRVDRMDMVGGRVAVRMSGMSERGWETVVGVIDSDQGNLISVCGPIQGHFVFDWDLRLSPDASLVALYGYYLVPQFPRRIDLMWPYSQKQKGYLAVWRVQDGKLLMELDEKVFVPELACDFRVKGNNSRRAFRIEQFLELGWVGTGENAQVRLPDGFLISVHPHANPQERDVGKRNQSHTSVAER